MMTGAEVPKPSSSTSFSYSDFVPVRSRKKRKNKGQSVGPPSILLPPIQRQLGQDEWFAQSLQLIDSSWNDFLSSSGVAIMPNSIKVLCLGLGSPSTSQNARVQLAFLIETCKHLKIAHDYVSIYDPVFNTEDTAFLKDELQMKVLTKNRARTEDAPEESQADEQRHSSHSSGWHTLSGPTICFMPHCDIELYDSVISSNWSRQGLSNLFLLGNSLQEYLVNKPTGVLQATVPSLLRAAPILENKPLPSSSVWPTAFNNTSVQYVRRQDLLAEISLEKLFYDNSKSDIDALPEV